MGEILLKDCKTRLWVPDVIHAHSHTEALYRNGFKYKWLDLYFNDVLLFKFVVRTICLLFPRKSESDRSVTEAGREVLCSPLENGPVQRHVHEDCRLL